MNLVGYAGYRARVEKGTDEIIGLDPVAMLRERMDQEQAKVEERTVAFIHWAQRVPEPKSGTLDFGRFPFQRELYEQGQSDREIVIQKATQVGISAFLVRWTMFWADVRGLTALYVFPKQVQMYDFADTRVRPLVLGSEYLRSRVPAVHVQNKGLKQIGLGFVYYRGSESKDALDSVDADVLALDEYDTLTQANIPDAERRITGSMEGLIRRVGVPSIPDWGINRLYEASDRRQWRVKCGACNTWQTLDFDKNVDQREAVVVCEKCVKPLDVRRGEWVADFPDRDVRGYHVPRLAVPHANLRDIINASRDREPYKVQVHYNKDLGLPYASEEGRLSPQVLAAAERPYGMVQSYVSSGELVTMGVDVASARALNVRISIHRGESRNGRPVKGALWIGTVDTFDDLSGLMERYDVNLCGIDHMPEHRLARAFAERYPGRVYLVRYPTSRATKLLDVDEEMRVATVRRTEAIDATMTMIREQRNHLPLDRPDDYNRQMMAAVRFVETDELGKLTVGYRSTGPDDYLHAEAYDLIATELWHIRQDVEESQREVLQPLDDLMEFKRSALHVDPDEVEYSAGRDDEYHAGPGEDDDGF